MITALVGAGRMGQRYPEIVSHLGWTLAGVSDRSDAAMEQIKSQTCKGSLLCTNDVSDLLEQLKPQVLIIATTATSHYEYVRAGIDNDVDFILCEKPLTVSLDQADRLIQASSAKDIKLAVNHQMRFMEQYTGPKQLMADKNFGNLVSVIVSASNFGLSMNGCHYFEMVRYMADSNLDWVQAWFEEERLENPRGQEFEDRSGRLVGKTTSGVTVYMDLSGKAGHGVNTIFICRNGQIIVNELTGQMSYNVRQHEYLDMPTSRYGMPAHNEIENIKPADLVLPTVNLLKAMVEGDNYPSGEVEGLHTMQCMAAAHHSHDNGSIPVNINDEVIDRNRVFPWA